MSKNRTTVHKGKVGSAKHNEHKTKGKDRNVTPKSFKGNTNENKFSNGGTLEAKELKFYERYCEQLAQQNEKYKSARQYGRIKSLEEFYNSKRYKPTEEIIQYGHAGGEVPTKEEFDSMMFEYTDRLKDWSKQHGNHLQILNCVGHHDESTPHGHIRSIWDFVDDDGVIKINQEKAMEQAGLELPYPDKPVGRYNNRNMTFTKICRDMWNDICEQHGYEVERVPLENGRKKSETIPEYHARKGRELKAQEESLKAREREVVKIIGDITGIDYKDSITIEETLEDLSSVKDAIDEKYDKADELMAEAAKTYQTAKDFYLREQEWLSEEGKQHRKKQAEEEAKRQEEIQKKREQLKRDREIRYDVDEIMSKWESYTEPNEDEDDMSIV